MASAGPASASSMRAWISRAHRLRAEVVQALRQEHQVRLMRRAHDGVAQLAQHDFAPDEGEPHAAPHSRRASATAELAFSL